MSEERIDIVIEDKVSPKVKSSVLEIARSAKVAHSALERLKQELNSINATALNKLANASAKVTNSIARQVNANARLMAETRRKEIQDFKSALSQQKLATEIEKTRLATERTSQAKLKSAGVSAKLDAQNIRNANSQQKLATEVERTRLIAEKSKQTQQRLATEAQRTNLIFEKAKEVQQKFATELERTNLTSERTKLTQQQVANQIERTKSVAEKTAQSQILSQQRLATELERTRAASERAKIAQSNATSASARAEIQTMRLKAAQEKLAQSSNNATSSFGRFVRQAAVFFGLSFSAVAAVNAADAYTNLQNKLRNVVETESQLAVVSQEVFEIANKTRAPVEDTARAFQRFDLALMQLGKSQQESLDLTETVNQALVLSGSTTGEQAAALLQLSQAFNKGKLDGDEFRTVMELMPPIADAIAKELGVARGQLLNLAPEGKITAEVMATAFKKAKEEIGDKFATIIPTIGQSLVVLKNRAIEFFGALDDKVGVTRTIAKAILFLGNNLDVLSVALIAVSSAALVAFSPAIVLRIGAMSTAIKTFTLALASNPLGLAVVALTTLVAAFAIFKDDIKVTSDGLVTMGDVFASTLNYMSVLLVPTVNFFKDLWEDLVKFVKGETEGMGGSLAAFVGEAAINFKKFINFHVGLFRALFTSILIVWNQFPNAFGDIFKTASNFALDVIEKTINGVISKLKILLDLADKAANFLGLNPIFGEIGKVDLSKFKSDIGVAGQVLVRSISNVFKEEMGTDFVGDVIKTIGDGAVKIAQEREKQGELRKERDVKGVVPVPKGEIKRADALAKINRELQREIDLLQVIGPEQEIQSRFSQIENDLLNKKIVLNKEEAKQIMDKIVLIEKEQGVHEKLSDIYNQTEGSFRSISDGIEAANRAYERGIINAETYANKIVELNKQAAELRVTLGDGTWGDVFTASFAKVVESYQGYMPEMLEAFTNLFESLKTGFADSLGQAIVYGDNLAESLREVARSALAELISAIVQLGIQWAITESLKASMSNKTTAAVAAQTAAVVASNTTTTASSIASIGAQTAAGTAAAEVQTTAWAKPATLASIATFGGAALLGITAILTALALTKGFKSGGYTGGGDPNDVAGVVHGKEFVMDASTTSRIGVSNLEALRTGAARVTRNSEKAGSAISVTAGPQEAPIVNTPISMAIVSSKESAIAALKSKEGKAFIIETLEENRQTVARIIGAR